MAAMTWNGAVANLPGFLQAGFPQKNDAASDLQAAMRTAGPAIGSIVTEHATARIEAVLQGIRAYHAHPYRRRVSAPPVAAHAGCVRLFDFGSAYGHVGQAVVAVPSLINPSYILDLMPEQAATSRSLMRYLARSELRPLLVDWGTPGLEETSFTTADYVTRRLEPLLEKAARQAGGPVPVIGYCMGGNLALAAAARRPDLVSAVALIATPWDFHAPSVTLNRAVATLFSGLIGPLAQPTTVPVELAHLFFASLDPTLTDRKFRRFARLDGTSRQATLFVAMEDWVNDGAPLAAAVARECLDDWYGRNLPGRGAWQVGGVPVDPARISQPALVVAPRSDRIVPSESALALARALPDPTVRNVAGGHVSMVVGPGAEDALWKPLVTWLKS
ncbi:MAG: alpha/beta fold hydrolase [Sphingomonadales bacterium]